MALVRSVLFGALVVYWGLTTFIIVPAVCTIYFVCFLLPLRLVNRPLFLRLEHMLCRLVNDQWASCCLGSGARIFESGDDVSGLTERRCLVVCNHLGLCDHFMLMTAMHNKGTVPERYLWLIYNIWKWTPLGLMWILHGNFFVNGGARQREQLLGSFGEHLKRNYWMYDHRWIVMYPEGSRLFLAQEGAQRFAKKHGYPDLKHCALPRLGAARVVLDVCGPKKKNGIIGGQSVDHKSIDYVIDITLGYSKGRIPVLGRAMLNDWPGNDARVDVHYRVYKVSNEVVDNESNLRKFLYDMWVEKDARLDYFYEHGCYPDSQPTRLNFPKSRAFVVQLFWLLSMILHWLWLQPLILFVGRQLLSFLL